MDADVKSFDPIAASQNLKAGFIDYITTTCLKIDGGDDNISLGLLLACQMVSIHLTRSRV